MSPGDAIQRYPVRHEAFHDLVIVLVQTGNLSSAPALVRRNAAAILGDYGRTNRACALAALAGLNEDDNAEVRLQALDALYDLDPDPPLPEAERRIRILLASRRGAPKLADRVLAASGPIGRGFALSAAPGLASEERLWLLGSLSSRGHLTPAEVTFLRRSLSDPAPELRLQAAHLAGPLGGDGVVVVADLLGRLVDDDPRVRRAALFAIGDIRPTDSAAIDQLERLLTDPGAETR